MPCEATVAIGPVNGCTMTRLPRRASRRDVLRQSVGAGLASTLGFALPWLSRANASAPLASLALWGPPAGPSIVLAHAVATRTLRDVADKVEIKIWRNPDEMRAGLTSGTMQAVVMPTQVAANLFNRGLGIRLLNTMTDGLLHVVSADATLTSIEALRGRKIAAPFRNDMPEFVFNRLLMDKGLVPGRDLAVETTGSPIEAIQLLLAGRLDAALVPEPAATAAIVKGKLAGKTILRVIDIQKLWRELDPASDGILPQAGLAVTERLLKDHPELVDRLHAHMVTSAEAVRAMPSAAANNAAAVLEFPWPVIEQSIPWSRLECRRARHAQPYLEAMFRTIAASDPTLLGGKLPANEFYL